jgi:hypothetical protein
MDDTLTKTHFRINEAIAICLRIYEEFAAPLEVEVPCPYCCPFGEGDGGQTRA